MDDAQYLEVKNQVNKVLSINLDYYKEEQMKRRLGSWLTRSGYGDWDKYFEFIRTSEMDLLKFRNFLTINVTEFFRDKERWGQLEEKILPKLINDLPNKNSLGDGLRIWSAGCSTGAEPYTLGILLNELAPSKKHYILGTDLDKGALAKARDGGPYHIDEIKNVSEERRKKYFEIEKDKAIFKTSLLKSIYFKEQNLITDIFENNFDLIVCRNVVIYFKNEAKNQIYKKFFDALRASGILFIGGTEIIPRPNEFGFNSFGVSCYIKEKNL
ncbi:MAG: protein-glutamate O-methyltransferase CheR [Anaerolineaceae bacterium]|nr:protein-glutamate O-methyltransferase CheR [Anaerolineaceae bacterium]